MVVVYTLTQENSKEGVANIMGVFVPVVASSDFSTRAHSSAPVDSPRRHVVHRVSGARATEFVVTRRPSLCRPLPSPPELARRARVIQTRSAAVRAVDPVRRGGEILWIPNHLVLVRDVVHLGRGDVGVHARAASKGAPSASVVAHFVGHRVRGGRRGGAVGGDVRTVRDGLRLLGGRRDGVRVSHGAEDVQGGRSGYDLLSRVFKREDGERRRVTTAVETFPDLPSVFASTTMIICPISPLFPSLATNPRDRPTKTHP